MMLARLAGFSDAPAFGLVASSTGSSSNAGATVNVSKPAGVLDGHLMIAVMTGGTTAVTWTGASGWTEVLDQNASPNLRIAYKIASGEGSSYNFTSSSSVNKAATIVAFRNATYAQIGTVGTASSGGSATAPGVTVSSANSILLACFGIHDGSNFTTPSGMSEVVSFNAAENPALAVFSQSVGSGATGSRSSDPAGNGNVAGVLVVIQKA